MFKPPFGQTNTTTGFGAFAGAANANPFGQTSVFGKTTNTGFAPPAFGASGSTNLFSNTLSSSGNLFRSSTATPTFGQAQTTQPSFSFGSTPQPTTNLFGAQQNTGTGLFGSSGSSAFGANKPPFATTFGTGTSTTLFGAQQPAQSSTSLFGQATPSTGTGLFGASTGAFGASNQQTGTVIKFNPVTGTDNLMKNGVTQTVSTRHFCITCMKEYESKSLEELRLEDYMANRKGPQQSNLFGTPTQQPSLFGSTPATTSLFGNPQTTENKTLFGQTNTSLGGFGTSSSNVFGSTPVPSNSLFGSKPGFGTTTTTTPAFSFGQTSTNNMFGNTQNKSFGTTPQTGIFGQTPTQQTAGFGTNTGFSSFGTTQNQSIGLFGNKPASTFNLNTTTTAGFTFGSNTTTSTGIFGAKPATTGFGATSTPSFGTAFGTGNTFGTSTAIPTSVFKPSTNFSFGSMQNTGGFGTNTSTNTGSIFGSTAQKPGGLFGSAPSTGMFGSSFGNTTNTFGSTNLNLGTSTVGSSSLFGNTSMLPSQSTTSSTHPAILALASVPFADSALFKNLLPASGKTDSLLKPSNAVTQRAMLACKDLKVSPKNSVKIKLKPIATPLTKKSLFEGLEESDVVSPSFITTSNVKKLTLKPKTFNTTLPTDDWTEGASNKENQSDKINPRRVSFTIPSESQSGEKDSFYIRRNPLFKPQRQSTLVDLEQTALTVGNEPCSAAQADTSQTDVNKSGGTPSNNTLLDDTAKDSSKHSNSSLDETHGYFNDTSHYDEEWEPHPTGIVLKRLDYYTIPKLDDLVNLIGSDGSCLVDNFCIGRYGYGNLYFDETMDVAGLNIDEIVHFRHKEVNVYPDDDKKPLIGNELNRKCQVTLEQVWPVDKTTREPIKDPERLLKLKYEEKLRRSTAKMGATFVEYRPATGSWVFKVDHFSKYGLTDSDDEEGLLEENKVPPGGLLKMKGASGAPPPGVTPSALQPRVSQNKFPFQSPTVAVHKQQCSNIPSPILAPAHQTFTLGEVHNKFMNVTGDQIQEKSNYPESDLGLDIDEEMDDEDPSEGFDLMRSLDKATEHLSPSVHLARRTGIDSHRVQLMKASLFEEERDDGYNELEKYDGVQLMDYTNLGDLQQDHLDTLKLARGLHTFKAKFKTQPVFSKAVTHFDARMDIPASELPLTPHYAPSLPILRPRPKTVSIVNTGTILPFAKSSLAKHSTRCVSDSGIYIGRSFKNGWGPRSILMSLSTHLNFEPQDNHIDFGGRPFSDNSYTTVQRLFLYRRSDIKFKESIKEHLKIQLNNSNRGEEDGCPLIVPKPGVEALHAHCNFAADQEPENSFDLYCLQVWELCVALWGNLSTLTQEDPLSHKTMMARKEALTEWLKTCAAKTIRKEVEESDSSREPNKHVSAVLSLLSGREIEEACDRLQKNGDHFAALLLSSGPSAKPFSQNQLSEWQNVGADSYIDEKKLKFFCLSSGLPLFSSAQGIINICEELDWKRAFAMHFWYLLSPLATIGDIIKKYETAFDGEEAYACRPNPPYGEATTQNGRHIYDLCYHLIKLYCFKSHSLEQLLNPATYTSDPLDHRLSWLLEQVLISLGYVHLSKMSSAINCVGFASQLEAYGLWHWSIFVYLHLPDGFRRKQAAVDSLNRHVTLLEDRGLTEEETFVIDDLGIPAEWVYRSKATLAVSLSRYHDAAYYLIQAREWNEVHQIIIKHIAADAVVNENYDYLRDLLEPLVPNSAFISEWFYLGQLLWDYLEVNRVVQQALLEQDTYELESRQTQISSVCARIVRWPCPTVKDRLCQAEIAKRMAHIYCNVIQLQVKKNQTEVNGVQVTNVISKLPLPEDYLMEELRYVKEVFPLT
ncbi:hypothetical protein RUM43_010680 [Polyplax serrata]|uniref:Nuclear pore complex protein Nup98-Nup96 n=1 Tax=Polyplax serrata TaxID=468196 RepID=A0AAN8P4E5_POLSC